jgi:hypothetical protein
MKKIIRLTESDLTRIVRRAIKEQFNKETLDTIETPPSDDYEMSSEEDLRKNNLRDTVIPQLEEIFHNFNKIDCENIGGYEHYSKTPEYVQIYCRHYKGKTRSEIHNLIKKHKTQIGEV